MKVSFVNGKNAIIGELNVSPHGCNKIAQESRGPNAVTIKKKKVKSLELIRRPCVTASRIINARLYPAVSRPFPSTRVTYTGCSRSTDL